MFSPAVLIGNPNSNMPVMPGPAGKDTAFSVKLAALGSTHKSATRSPTVVAARKRRSSAPPEFHTARNGDQVTGLDTRAQFWRLVGPPLHTIL